jgi:hypothetical protein
MALIVSWPGPIHEGHGKASYYIDNRQIKNSSKPYRVLLQVKLEEALLHYMQAQ